MRVLVFGASITQGFWDTEGGWVQRLRKHYDQLEVKDRYADNHPTIFNLGISGDTAKKLLLRIENETKARKQPSDKMAFVFSIGTNNAIEENGQLRSTPEQYRQELEAIVKIAKKYSNKVMLVGLSSCDDTLTQPVSWASSIYYTNERIKRVEDGMRIVSASEKAKFVPIFEAMKTENEKGNDLLADGLHPNNAGHEFIYSLVLPHFEKLISG